MKKYRIWLVDKVEPLGGSWWNCYLGDDGKLYDYIYTDEQADTLEWFIKHDYIIEEI